MSEPTQQPDVSHAAPLQQNALTLFNRIRQPEWMCGWIVLATVFQLRVQGRRWWCACGSWMPLSSDAYGSHNSQHWFDPYSLSHVLHGLLFYGLLVLICPQVKFAWRVVLAVLLECGWEILENTNFVINRYRDVTAALGYEGDSIANSLGDVLSCAAGYWIARRLRIWQSLALFVAIELILLFWIRDNLTLNVIMLFFPLESIRTWQTGG